MGNTTEPYTLEQRLPFRGAVDAQSNMVDARGGGSRREVAGCLDQMDDRLAICIQPVAADAERRARTLSEADDGAEEVPRGFEVRGDDRCMVKFHDETQPGCSWRDSAHVSPN